mmetsp:Transcript_23748/g.42581  ORF Transcript_23748/g.42581 Transcript_23748/m.42581 type:complete len:390 (-) Transcript_23748:1400-2569(-)
MTQRIGAAKWCCQRAKGIAHALGQSIDQVAKRLKHQRNQRFLQWGRLCLRGVPQCLQRLRTRQRVQARLKRAPLFLQIAQDRIVIRGGHVPLRQMAGDPLAKRSEARLLCVGQTPNRAHTAQRRFPRHHPIVQQYRVIDQKRGHAQTRRISDPQMARQLWRKSPLPHMLHQIEGEMADQIDGQHLGGKRTIKTRAIRKDMTVGNPELPVAINSSRPHQIADIADHCRIWLRARAQGIHRGIPHADRLIRTAEDQIARAEPACLLLGRICSDPGNVFRPRHPVKEDKGRVPCRRNHPVTALVRGQVVGNRNQRIGVTAQIDAIDRVPMACRCHVPDRADNPRTLRTQTTHQDPQKAEPRGHHRPHAGQAHHLAWGAQGHCLINEVFHSLS